MSSVEEGQARLGSLFKQVHVNVVPHDVGARVCSMWAAGLYRVFQEFPAVGVAAVAQAVQPSAKVRIFVKKFLSQWPSCIAKDF